MDAVLKETVEKFLRDVSLVGKELAVDALGELLPHHGVPVVDAGPRQQEGYELAPVVAGQVQLEAMAPAHGPLPVGGETLEDLVGVAPEVVAYGYHCRVDEGDARAAAEGPEVEEEHQREEHPALQLDEAVVRYGIGEIR